MEGTFIVNGSIKLILKPQSELEVQMLTELLKQPIEATQIATMQVGTVQYTNAVVITQQGPKQG